MYSYLKCIVYDKLLKRQQTFRIILYNACGKKQSIFNVKSGGTYSNQSALKKTFYIKLNCCPVHLSKINCCFPQCFDKMRFFLIHLGKLNSSPVHFSKMNCFPVHLSQINCLPLQLSKLAAFPYISAKWTAFLYISVK